MWEERTGDRKWQGEHEIGAKTEQEGIVYGFQKTGGTLGSWDHNLPHEFGIPLKDKITWTGANWEVPRMSQSWFPKNTYISSWYKLFSSTVFSPENLAWEINYNGIWPPKGIIRELKNISCYFVLIFLEPRNPKPENFSGQSAQYGRGSVPLSSRLKDQCRLLSFECPWEDQKDWSSSNLFSHPWGEGVIPYFVILHRSSDERLVWGLKKRQRGPKPALQTNIGSWEVVGQLWQ